MSNTFRRLIVGAATLATMSALQLTATPAYAESDGIDVTVWWGGDGDYVAEFHHTGDKGETLEVFDNKSDGYAAVAYIEYESGDKDRAVMDQGYHEYNLRDGDSGEYDVPEGQTVWVMICRGYQSIPGDNCSEWDFGLS